MFLLDGISTKGVRRLHELPRQHVGRLQIQTVLQVEQGVDILPIFGLRFQPSEAQLHWRKLWRIRGNSANLMSHSAPMDTASQLDRRDKQTEEEKILVKKNKIIIINKNK